MNSHHTEFQTINQMTHKMNDIFNFRRFGKYFLSDLTRLYSDNWLKILCFGLIPVFAAMLSLMFSLIGNYDYSYAGIGARDTFWSISVVIFCVWLPATCFGYVTDKRAGGNFMLVPASTFEKTASMIINTAVIIPAAFIAIYMTSDFLCTIASGEEMRESLAVHIGEGIFFGIAMKEMTGHMLLSVHAGMLFFLLGAVFFRKGKISKSILVLFGLGIILLFAVFFVLKNMANMSVEELDMIADTDFSTWATVLAVLQIIVFYILIYFRIRKIQY